MATHEPFLNIIGFSESELSPPNLSKTVFKNDQFRYPKAPCMQVQRLDLWGPSIYSQSFHQLIGQWLRLRKLPISDVQSNCHSILSSLRQVFVSSGAGTSVLPIRFLAQAQWDLITLR